MLAYLWELEVKLEDLDLPELTVKRMLDQLKSNNAKVRLEAREQLRKSYLRSASAQLGELPTASAPGGDTYSDGRSVFGDVAKGRLLYTSACAGCHGSNVNPMNGAKLVDTDRRFHRYVLRGTERNDLYMPLFTSQRLSRRQMADIRAYLRTLSRFDED